MNWRLEEFQEISRIVRNLIEGVFASLINVFDSFKSNDNFDSVTESVGS